MVGLFFCFEHGIGYLLKEGTLNIETSRRQGLAPEQRICPMCDDGACEDDLHFLISHHPVLLKGIERSYTYYFVKKT